MNFLTMFYTIPEYFLLAFLILNFLSIFLPEAFNNPYSLYVKDIFHIHIM